jgi:hypothetical protein
MFASWCRVFPLLPVARSLLALSFDLVANMAVDMHSASFLRCLASTSSVHVSWTPSLCKLDV